VPDRLGNQKGEVLMVHPGTRSKALARRGAAVAIALMCPAAGAAAASAATLNVTVPATVVKGKGYPISVQGTFQKSETASGKAFVISVIQFSPKACLASAQAEARSHRVIQFYLAPQSNPAKGAVGVFEKKSPFKIDRAFTAGKLGARRVCSWLYPSFIASPNVATAPIARADKRYRVTAK
jgi:hypothetical protein